MRDLQLELWEPGGAFLAKVQYQDTVRTSSGPRTQDVDGVVKPDSLFLMTGRNKRIHYFPEADRSTMTNARYLVKLKAYYAFWATYVRDGRSSPIKAQTQHSCHQPQSHPCGCDQRQCQIEFPISCDRRRHKINVRHIPRTVPNRLKPI
jgi:hypothetical protein